jgi:hypothetical protein
MCIGQAHLHLHVLEALLQVLLHRYALAWSKTARAVRLLVVDIVLSKQVHA